MNIKFVLGMVLAGTAVVFIMQNVASADMTFLFWTLSISWALLMLLVLALGIILGWLLRASNRTIKSMPMQGKAQ